MGRICQKCHKTYSSRQSLWNRKKYCKGETKHHSFLARREQNQHHKKTFADALFNDDLTSKDKTTAFLESLRLCQRELIQQKKLTMIMMTLQIQMMMI